MNINELLKSGEFIKVFDLLDIKYYLIKDEFIDITDYTSVIKVIDLLLENNTFSIILSNSDVTSLDENNEPCIYYSYIYINTNGSLIGTITISYEALKNYCNLNNLEMNDIKNKFKKLRN